MSQEERIHELEKQVKEKDEEIMRLVNLCNSMGDVIAEANAKLNEALKR